MRIGRAQAVAARASNAQRRRPAMRARILANLRRRAGPRARHGSAMDSHAMPVEPPDRVHARATPGLLPRMLGPAFERLPDRVRWMHRGTSTQARGAAIVQGDSHWRARVL